MNILNMPAHSVFSFADSDNTERLYIKLHGSTIVPWDIKTADIKGVQRTIRDDEVEPHALDLNGNPVQLGRQYVYVYTSNGIATIVKGHVTNFTEEKVTLVPDSSIKGYKGDFNIVENSKKVSVRSFLLSPVVDYNCNIENHCT